MNVLCQDLRAGGQTDPVTYLQALRKGLQFILPEDEEIKELEPLQRKNLPGCFGFLHPHPITGEGRGTHFPQPQSKWRVFPEATQNAPPEAPGVWGVWTLVGKGKLPTGAFKSQLNLYFVCLKLNINRTYLHSECICSMVFSLVGVICRFALAVVFRPSSFSFNCYRICHHVSFMHSFIIFFLNYKRNGWSIQRTWNIKEGIFKSLLHRVVI